jgi:hypothetical protein
MNGRRLLVENAGNFQGGPRPTKVKALKLIAPFGFDACEFFLRFHAFRSDRDPQAAAQSDHGAHDRNGSRGSLMGGGCA